MKKILAFIFAAALTLGFAACKNNTQTAETTSEYYAQYKNADSHGYIPFVNLTVDADGKITDVEFDWKSEDDEEYRKSKDEDYAENWRNVDPEMDQNIAIKQLTDALKDKQDISKVDSVAGATGASDQFIDLVTQLMEQRVKENNTKPLVVENEAAE